MDSPYPSAQPSKSVRDDPGGLLTNAVAENDRRNVDELRHTSPIISKLVDQGRVKIVGGINDLHDGVVDFAT